ncbi:hypothetical protein MMC14_008571 [Varicellaria rhodocarpa]|nr:hypothetical protein [Varicellaria rhodocarpa]
MDEHSPDLLRPNSTANFESSLPDVTRATLEFEKRQWATGSVTDDPFYAVPKDSADALPGTLLKLEKDVDTSMFTLPPATALSRLMFRSITFHGSLVPVSGFILWPYSPRNLEDGYAVVAWSHGTTGVAPNSAPSHMKNLHQHYLGPYQLALQGYVVVAADYAGLGVGTDASGKTITHEYLASPSHANDVLYSVQAAQAAFPELSKHFIVIGQSQGGGAAWSAAQRQVIEPVDGYLGAIAVSPVTKILDEGHPILSTLGIGILPSLSSLFPAFKPSDILTPDGVKRFDTISRMGGGIASGLTLIMGGDNNDVQLLKPTWTENPHVQEFQSLTANDGSKSIAGPLLVIHGESDLSLSVDATTAAVERTMNRFPESQIEYVRLPGVSHSAALTASQPLWMDWIAERFAGLTVMGKKADGVVRPGRPVESYQEELNWTIEPAGLFFEGS